uniref:8.9 kDa family member n=1 Tax=Rhipicephalus zambeziensis TaxID=60191 RepID=A0A224Y773_9ACAR
MKLLLALLYFSLLLTVIAAEAADTDDLNAVDGQNQNDGSSDYPQTDDENDESDSSSSEEEEEESLISNSDEQNEAGKNEIYPILISGNCTVENVTIPNGGKMTVRTPASPHCQEATCSGGRVELQLCTDPEDAGEGCYPVSDEQENFPRCCPRMQCY